MGMFTAKTRFADMFSVNYNLVLLMPRLGISLGFGDKSVQDVCKSYNLPVDFVLMVCNMYTFDTYKPTLEEIQSVNLSMLIPYLKSSHEYYLKERLPHIERHLAGVAKYTDERCAKALVAFFAQYKKEINDHFEFEEKNIFPYLEDTISKNNKISPKTLKSELSHDGFVDKISDLLQILYKYMPSRANTEELNELIFFLLQLSADFQNHASIEEHVLLPYILNMERISHESKN